VALIGGISKKVLTQTLRRLQTNGLVTRQDFGGVPPRVEYDLTELGKTLMEPIRMLTTWAADNGEAVLAAQEESLGSEYGFLPRLAIAAEIPVTVGGGWCWLRWLHHETMTGMAAKAAEIRRRPGVRNRDLK
jgi:hypothetical protein